MGSAYPFCEDSSTHSDISTIVCFLVCILPDLDIGKSLTQQPLGIRVGGYNNGVRAYPLGLMSDQEPSLDIQI